MSSPELKVVIVVRRLVIGGAQQQAAMLANGLRRRLGLDTSVVAFHDGHHVRELLDPDIPVRVCDPGSEGGWLHRGVRLLRFVKELRSARPDVLLPFTDQPNRVIGAVWPLSGAKACVWNQRDEGREITHRPLERLAIRQSSWFVANSGSGRRHLLETFAVPRERITVIANGVVLKPARHDRAEWRRRLQIPAGAQLAAMVAHLHRFKDHETLLRAWRLVANRSPTPPVLVLAGQHGTTATRILAIRDELGLQDLVHLPGVVDDVTGLLGACDFVVFSSRFEGCPNAVLEAMAVGLPVVATGITGIREALGDDCPSLVPENDAGALAEAILELTASDARRQALGEANRIRVQRLFTPETAVEAYGELIASLARRHSR